MSGALCNRFGELTNAADLDGHDVASRQRLDHAQDSERSQRVALGTTVCAMPLPLGVTSSEERAFEAGTGGPLGGIAEGGLRIGIHEVRTVKVTGDASLVGPELLTVAVGGTTVTVRVWMLLAPHWSVACNAAV